MVVLALGRHDDRIARRHLPAPRTAEVEPIDDGRALRRFVVVRPRLAYEHRAGRPIARVGHALGASEHGDDLAGNAPGDELAKGADSAQDAGHAKCAVEC